MKVIDPIRSSARAFNLAHLTKGSAEATTSLHCREPEERSLEAAFSWAGSLNLVSHSFSVTLLNPTHPSQEKEIKLFHRSFGLPRRGSLNSVTTGPSFWLSGDLSLQAGFPNGVHSLIASGRRKEFTAWSPQFGDAPRSSAVGHYRSPTGLFGCPGVTTAHRDFYETRQWQRKMA
jgi:hypothetical protein